MQPRSPDETPEQPSRQGPAHRVNPASYPPPPPPPPPPPEWGQADTPEPPEQPFFWQPTQQSGEQPVEQPPPAPYFSGLYSGPDHYYRSRRRRRSALGTLISAAGFLGISFLILGFLSLTFDWNAENRPVEMDDYFASEPAQPPAELPELSTSELVDQLDNAHQGVTVNWEDGGQHTGPGLDPGQEVHTAPGVFMVDTKVYQYVGYGTGMVVDSNGLAITNYHVVESSMVVSVTMADTEERYEATVVGRDASKDIAVLQIHTDKPLEVASINPDPVKNGDTVAGVGNAGGQGYLTSVVGEVAGTNETIRVESEEPGSADRWLDGLIRITSDIVPGYSGGPTVDANGQVIGVSTAASHSSENSAEAFGFILPITDALTVVEQVLAGDESGDVVIGSGGALGIVVSSEPDGGARIIEIRDGSAAASIGMQLDDIITAIDGREVPNSTFISRYVRDLNAGDTVEVTWKQPDGTVQQANVELDEATIN